MKTINFHERLMLVIKSSLFVLLAFVIHQEAFCQPPRISDDFLIINATGSDPLFTTYTATIERSRLYGDKGYKMDYYSSCNPLSYGSDKGGKMYCIWEIDKVVVDKQAAYHEHPVVIASFPDMAVLIYQPWPGIQVHETFFVYSSKLALVEMHIQNASGKPHNIDLFPILEVPDSLHITKFDSLRNGFITTHYETKKRLISNLYGSAPYPTHLRDLFTGDFNIYSYGGYRGDMSGFYDTIKTDFYSDNRSDSLNMKNTGYVDFISLHTGFLLNPGQSTVIRYYRGIQDEHDTIQDIIDETEYLKDMSLQPFIDNNVRLFSSVPRIDFETDKEKIVYLSAFNLVRGCMLPPAGETDYNFYAFSREPLWGWGHGHQVLHESLSMLAYVYLDPVSAQNSQRVYMEQQGADGLIAYRHGPRGAQTYPHQGKPTTSAPFYSWINWEVYEVSKDREFLEDAYESGVKYTNWLIQNRDVDHDGTFEWGPYGIIENVRDWYNAVFQVSAERYLDVDKEDISDELECLDLSLMVVNEMRHLAKMAEALGRLGEAESWIIRAGMLSKRINELMWEEESGFFYSVNRDDHTFFFLERDLRRQEIIGFLPLWAEAVTPDKADILINTLTDKDKFWRKYGIPTLAADDPWYSPYVDYCCKWNGPVWLLWDYMVFDGLVKYGYNDLAIELSDKMMLAVTEQLSKNHNFWESYSPDNEVLNCPSNYIWDAIMAKLLIVTYELKSEK